MNQHVNPPASPVERLYYPTPVTPEEAFQAIGRLRKEARDEIDRLIRFLDKTDDYVARELEENGDEFDASYPDGTRLCSSPMEDDEDGDPAEDSDGAGDEDSGIGDMDGLSEQVGGHYGSFGGVQ